VSRRCWRQSRIFALLFFSIDRYVDVEKIFDEAVSLFSDLHDVNVVNKCHGLTVLADSLLRQLFYNLIDNSLKYGQKTSQISIYYEKAEGEQVRIVCEDDGVGISPSVKTRLFSEGSSSSGGSGYGLFLIKKIAEVCGWSIQETGTLGRGAQFTVTIPKMNLDREESYQLHWAYSRKVGMECGRSEMQRSIDH
jgi:signal transduction histidine kinase